MAERLVDDGHRILDAVRRLVRLLRVSDRSAQERVGLSAAQLFALYELGKSPEISLGELAERTRTDQSSVSTVVKRLVRSGLVQRDRASDDARRLVLSPTRAGRSALKKAPPVAQEQLLDAVERMAATDRKRFADLFEELLAELGAETGSVPMLFEDELREGGKKEE